MSYNIRVPKRWARLAAILGVVALIAAPLTAVAAHSFDDVPNSHTFHEDIAWLKASGVTIGCNPPANNLYCPEDDVTRAQMSAFMRRLAQYLGAEDGTPAQADNADTLDGKSSSVFVEEGEANTVTSGMTTNEPGVAQTIVNSFSVSTTALAQVASVTINAPSDGFVVVHATSEAEVSHVNGARSGLDEYGVSASSSSLDADQDKDWIIADGAPSGIWDDAMAAHKIFPVSAGSNTFYLLAAKWGTSPNVGVNDSQLSAVFYASSYGAVESASSAGDEGSETDN
ncbi:MAG TPA: S-layer homology domain-containing protein [Acidimicrobiia bacterium]